MTVCGREEIFFRITDVQRIRQTEVIIGTSFEVIFEILLVPIRAANKVMVARRIETKSGDEILNEDEKAFAVAELWRAVPVESELNIKKEAKMTESGLPRRRQDFSIQTNAPPKCSFPCFFFVSEAVLASAYLRLAEKKDEATIQNTAPSPPTRRALTVPMTLPTPSVPARARVRLFLSLFEERMGRRSFIRFNESSLRQAKKKYAPQIRIKAGNIMPLHTLITVRTPHLDFICTNICVRC